MWKNIMLITMGVECIVVVEGVLWVGVAVRRRALVGS